MSIRSIEKFYLEAKENPRLREELSQIKKKILSEGLSPINAEKFIEKGLIPLAKKYGMVFSLDDLMDYASKDHARMLEQKKKIMSSDDLRVVSGGRSPESVNAFLLLQVLGIK